MSGPLPGTFDVPPDDAVCTVTGCPIPATVPVVVGQLAHPFLAVIDPHAADGVCDDVEWRCDSHTDPALE